MKPAPEKPVSPERELDEAVDSIKKLAAERLSCNTKDPSPLFDDTGDLADFDWSADCSGEAGAKESTKVPLAGKDTVPNEADNTRMRDFPPGAKDGIAPVSSQASRHSELPSLKPIGWMVVAGEMATAFVLIFVLAPWLMTGSYHRVADFLTETLTESTTDSAARNASEIPSQQLPRDVRPPPTIERHVAFLDPPSPDAQEANAISDVSASYKPASEIQDSGSPASRDPPQEPKQLVQAAPAPRIEALASGISFSSGSDLEPATRSDPIISVSRTSDLETPPSPLMPAPDVEESFAFGAPLPAAAGENGAEVSISKIDRPPTRQSMIGEGSASDLDILLAEPADGFEVSAPPSGMEQNHAASLEPDSRDTSGVAVVQPNPPHEGPNGSLMQDNTDTQDPALRNMGPNQSVVTGSLPNERTPQIEPSQSAASITAELATALALERKEALERERERADALTREIATLRKEVGALRARGTQNWMLAPTMLPTAEALSERDPNVSVPGTHVKRHSPSPAEPPHAKSGPEVAMRAPDVAVVGPAALHEPSRIVSEPVVAPNEQRLLDRAETLLASSDVSGARLVLERAMAAGSKRATYRLAQTYDPHILETWRVLGIKGDSAKAQELYAKAQTGR